MAFGSGVFGRRVCIAGKGIAQGVVVGLCGLGAGVVGLVASIAAVVWSAGLGFWIFLNRRRSGWGLWDVIEVKAQGAVL